MNIGCMGFFSNEIGALGAVAAAGGGSNIPVIKHHLDQMAA